MLSAVANALLIASGGIQMYSSTSLKAELNERGWRLTPQRKIILRFFQDLPSGHHLSAEEACELLNQQGHSISLSTIYRNLKLMARMGILRELELSEGYKSYELNRPYPHHHHHLVCVRCGKTTEFKNDSILKTGVKTSEREGFHLLDCQLTIQAICPACQRSPMPL